MKYFLKSKKVYALLMALTAFVLLAIPASASTDSSVLRAHQNSLCTSLDASYMLNALTWGTPANNDQVTVWKYSMGDDAATQRWFIDQFPNAANRYYIKNLANQNLTVSYNGYPQAVLAYANGNNLASQGVKLTPEGVVNGEDVYGLVLPLHLVALTANGAYNGATVHWLGSNGQHNQLWHKDIYRTGPLV